MINRAKMPRQLRNKGGITNVVPREKYGLGSKIKDRIRKLIPNEIANIAVKAAPFVAPFNPAIAGLMRGIGRFDQRGSLSDAFKQGLGTYAGGQLLRTIGGAGTQKGFGTPGDRFTSPLSADRTTAVKDFFKPGEKKDTDFIKKITGDTKKDVDFKSIKDATGLFKDVPILKDLPSLVQQQILVGGVSGAATYIYQAFLAEEPPQEEGETYEEYMARRRENVGRKMKGYFDNYFKFDKEYSSMTDEQKKAFVDRFNVKDGGRVSYQTGGITMANTLAENIRRNLANQAAVAQQFRQARKNIPGYVEPQRIDAPVQQSAQVMDPTRMIPQTSTLNPDLEQAIKNARAAGRNEEYIDTMLKERQDDQAIDFFKNLTPTPKKVIPVEPGPGGIDNLLPDLYEKVIGPAEPPRKIIPEEGTVGPITKLPVEPDPDTPIDELVVPIMPTLPVEPRTDQDLIEGFEKFKQENPEVMQGAGTTAIIQGTLPDGTPITFSGGVESGAFSKYLESLGLSRADIFKPKAMPVKSIGLEKLAKGGMPTGIMRTNKAGVMERDYRDKGGFVPVGIKEKADDVPAMLSKNEFVFTADAVRGAGNGSIEKGAQRMYDTMKKLEKRVV
jgi:hypothetical protein